MSALARIGDLVERRRDVVAAAQWVMAAIYFGLLLTPLLAPVGAGVGRFAEQAALWEEALFWGVWWPGVILVTLVFGQVWCGLLCPDGTLSEWASRRGRAHKPSRWLRSAPWPILGFSLVALASDLFDAHRSPLGALAAVGAVSAAAIVSGGYWGRGKRIWCRWLCPDAGVFSLLARAAILHFRVDRAAWDAAPRPPPKAVDCPLLLDVRRLTGNEKCNMCARCSGHRNAVVLAVRAPGAEIATLRDDELRLSDAASIVFVLVGLTFVGLHWRQWPWRQGLVDVLGPSRLAEIGLGAVEIALAAGVLGAALALGLWAAALGRRESALRLAYALVPLAGLGLFAGLAEHALALLAREGWATTDALIALRTLAVVVGAAWSLPLGRPALPATPGRRVLSFALWSALVVAVAALYRFAPFPVL